jgi:hypothetical protein
MQIYVINGPDGIGKTDFSVSLAENLKNSNKVLLIQGKRKAASNIEDYFNKDGMITYDIADYFTELAPLSMVVINQYDNLDFIISPLLEDKYEIKSEDITKLLSDVSYDYVIINGIDKNLLLDKYVIDIVGENDLSYVSDSDAFFINRVSEDYDVRKYKDQIDSKSSKFLGTVKEGEYFQKIIENIENNNTVEVAKIGFFERLRSGFRK